MRREEDAHQRKSAVGNPLQQKKAALMDGVKWKAASGDQQAACEKRRPYLRRITGGACLHCTSDNLWKERWKKGGRDQARCKWENI